jgi:hypothetical protein
MRVLIQSIVILQVESMRKVNGRKENRRVISLTMKETQSIAKNIIVASMELGLRCIVLLLLMLMGSEIVFGQIIVFVRTL